MNDVNIIVRNGSGVCKGMFKTPEENRFQLTKRSKFQTKLRNISTCVDLTDNQLEAMKINF